MTKKIFILGLGVFLLFGFVACQKGKNQDKKLSNVSAEVQDTGTIYDLSEKNNKVVFVKPGDFILVDLKVEDKPNLQWSYKDPITGGFLLLKEHPIIKENDARIKNGEYISRWKMKVLKAGEFNFRFHYGDSTKPKDIKQVFLVKVISGKSESEMPSILLESPHQDDVLPRSFLISGYTKISEKEIIVKIKDENGEIAQEINIPIADTASEYIYFEKKVTLKKPKTSKGTLEISRKDVPAEETQTLNISFE